MGVGTEDKGCESGGRGGSTRLKAETAEVDEVDVVVEELANSRGTISMRKSYISVREMAAAMSLFCNVLRLFSSVLAQARMVSSMMKSSQALANRTGASAEIILTSSSAFMIFLIRANGNS